jgi:glycosyltransferase involved in cell wall biosynthesis
MIVPWRADLSARDLWADAAPLTVFFNALSMAPGGSHSVLSNYWRCFLRQRPDWRLVMLRGAWLPEIDQDWGPNTCTITCGPAVAGVWRRTWWERRHLPQTVARFEADVYFAPNGVTQPRVRIPQLVMLADPTPYLLPSPDVFQRVRAALLRRAWVRSLGRADCMGYASQYMRSLVLKDAAGRAERRHLIAYCGIDQNLRERAVRPCLSRESRERFILSVSGFMPHKGFETLIRALALLRRDARFADVQLRILGRNIRVSGYVAKVSADYLALLEAEIDRCGLAGAVSLETDQPWEVVSRAYDRALLFSLVSTCESFGIPAVEAMAHGTPCVLGACCAIPEVAGDAAVLVPTGDAAALAGAWRRLLEDAEEFGRMQLAGRRRCLAFDWDDTVAQWVEVIEGLARPRATASMSVHA